MRLLPSIWLLLPWRVAGNTMASLLFRAGLCCVGFFVMIWIAAVMFKSNDILRKQTALKVRGSDLVYCIYQRACPASRG
jgi:hypothetical protein